jgi:hypothetical protein
MSHEASEGNRMRLRWSRSFERPARSNGDSFHLPNKQSTKYNKAYTFEYIFGAAVTHVTALPINDSCTLSRLSLWWGQSSEQVVFKPIEAWCNTC